MRGAAAPLLGAAARAGLLQRRCKLMAPASASRQLRLLSSGRSPAAAPCRQPRPRRTRTACLALQQAPVATAAGLGIPLGLGEVHIWWLQSNQVDSPALQQRYLELLPPAEREYVAQGSSAAVRKERLLARTLVRVVLARYCSEGVSPAGLCFEASPSGKPWLVSAEACSAEGLPLHFNLTHTAELLGVAVSRGRLVGLDAEDAARLTHADPLRLARRRFSEREVAVLQGFEDAGERARLFMRLWTLKEAYVKATGRGISAPPGLRAFSFELLLRSPRAARPAALPSIAAACPFELRFRPPAGDGRRWEALLLDVSGGHSAALVVEAAQPQAQGSLSSSGSSRSSGTHFDGMCDSGSLGSSSSSEGSGSSSEGSGSSSDSSSSSSEGSGSGSSSGGGGRPARPAEVRVFTTVPLVFEREADARFMRVLGYGRSDAG